MSALRMLCDNHRRPAPRYNLTACVLVTEMRRMQSDSIQWSGKRLAIWVFACTAVGGAGRACGAESFEGFPAGPVATLDSGVGRWRAEPGHAEVRDAGDVKIGGCLTRVEAALPVGTARIRFRCTSQAGVMLDDVAVVEHAPAKLAGVAVAQPVMPVMIRKRANPVLAINVRVTGLERPLVLDEVVPAHTLRRPQGLRLLVPRGRGRPPRRRALRGPWRTLLPEAAHRGTAGRRPVTRSAARGGHATPCTRERHGDR